MYADRAALELAAEDTIFYLVKVCLDYRLLIYILQQWETLGNYMKALKQAPHLQYHNAQSGLAK